MDVVLTVFGPLCGKILYFLIHVSSVKPFINLIFARLNFARSKSREMFLDLIWRVMSLFSRYFNLTQNLASYWISFSEQWTKFCHKKDKNHGTKPTKLASISLSLHQQRQ